MVLKSAEWQPKHRYRDVTRYPPGDLVGWGRGHDGLGRIREGDPDEATQHFREEAGARFVVVDVARLNQRVVRAQEGDDVAQILVRQVRELHHPGRRVAAGTVHARPQQVRNLTVGPGSDPLHRVLRDVARPALPELRGEVRHAPAGQGAGFGVEVATRAQELDMAVAVGDPLGRDVYLE